MKKKEVLENSVEEVTPEDAVASTVEDEPADATFTRRGFVKIAIAGAGIAYGAAIGYPIYRYLNSPVEKAAAMAAVTQVDLKDADKMPKGSALQFKFGTHPAMLIRHSDDTWVAFDAVCTHLGCTVAYEVDKDRIHCACHGGVYDARTGANVSGPPPRPLTKFRVEITKGLVTVHRV